jgi:hypothetical protein
MTIRGTSGRRPDDPLRAVIVFDAKCPGKEGKVSQFDHIKVDATERQRSASWYISSKYIPSSPP